MSPRVFYIYDYSDAACIEYVWQPKLACIVLADDEWAALKHFRHLTGWSDREVGDFLDVKDKPIQGAINNLDVNTDLCVHPDASRARIAEISFMKRMVDCSQRFGSSWA